MMLASNIQIKSKEDVIKTARCYLDRWRIEEYFKFKKQEYNFENFRVRILKSIISFCKKTKLKFIYHWLFITNNVI